MRALRYLTICLVALGMALGATLDVTQSATSPRSAAPLRIGALYPFSGSQGEGGNEEFDGARIAATVINAAGGVRGRPISFVTANAPSADAAIGAVDSLQKRGVRLVLGSYGSTISLPASAEAQRANLIFWESGAVATMVTQRGYRNVFRTVTTGHSLGRAAARYAASVVAPRVHLTPPHLRTAVIYANDVYGSSVGSAMAAEARALRFHLVGVLPYDPYHTRMARLVSRLKAVRPDIVLVVGYVQDALAFRRETLRQHLQPAAMIGTSSAFCMHAFGDTLGRNALGLFASDKPDTSFNLKALRPAARRLLQQARSAYRQRFHAAMTAPAVAGFVAGWILFHDVLPHATTLDPASVRAAALAVDLPYGSEINGAGVRFARPRAPDAGQNLRAISVIWQWQKPGHEYIVYPASYATSSPRWVPLPGWTRH